MDDLDEYLATLPHEERDEIRRLVEDEEETCPGCEDVWNWADICPGCSLCPTCCECDGDGDTSTNCD